MMQTLGPNAIGGNRAVAQNAAGNITGLLQDVPPAADVVESMAKEALELLGGWSWPVV